MARKVCNFVTSDESEMLCLHNKPLFHVTRGRGYKVLQIVYTDRHFKEKESPLKMNVGL